MIRYFPLWVLGGIGLSLLLSSPAAAQPMSLYQPPPAAVVPVPRPTMQDYNYTFLKPLPPREIGLHDIITIIVDDKSEVDLSSTFDRQRDATFEAAIDEFVRLDGLTGIRPAAADSPTIDVSETGRMRTNGRQVSREGIRYRIAATVVDILPNGNLVLEARKTVQSNDDIWQYSLSGVIRSRDVAANNTASSDNIASMRIAKRQMGPVYDSTKRRWGVSLFDWIWPF